jgi:hypothetical protein
MRNMCGEVFTSHTIIGGPGKQVLKAKFTRPFLFRFLPFLFFYSELLATPLEREQYASLGYRVGKRTGSGSNKLESIAFNGVAVRQSAAKR